MAAVGLANKRLGRRGEKGREEGAEDVIDGRGCLFGVDGSVWRSVAFTPHSLPNIPSGFRRERHTFLTSAEPADA